MGNNVSSLKAGDRVVPFQSGIGTWTSHAIYKEISLKRIPKDLGVLEACTITVNPPTAYRMLTDFVRLGPGDTVIQNGSNSAVGQAVFQLCREWKINCVGVVRDRPNIDELRAYLKSLGAAEVLTEEQVRTTQIFKSGQYKKPRLVFIYSGSSAISLLIPPSSGTQLCRWQEFNRNDPAPIR